MERKGEKQKQKLLYLVRILETQTDESHGLTMPQLIEQLQAAGVNADRKTLYLDLEELRDFGYDIISQHTGRHHLYHLGRRDFELPELKLLVDSVQAAKFITEKKSRDLIRKLEHLASVYDAEKLQRQVFMTGRVKTMNESIYYSIDILYDAIAKDRQIRFRYCQWELNRRMVPRRGGQLYQVSPWGLLCDNENYYLVAYDAAESRIKHYRVDKMQRIELLPDERLGKKAFKAFNLPRYAKTLFGMFGGEETFVSLEAENRMLGALIDRFGKDIPIEPVDEEHFRTVVRVCPSTHFYAWIMSLGSGVRITGPEECLAGMREEAERLCRTYGAAD